MLFETQKTPKKSQRNAKEVFLCDLWEKLCALCG